MKLNSVSRRRVLASISAMAATVTPAATTALSGLPGVPNEPDPIFAAMEAFERTKDELNNHPALKMELTASQEREMMRGAEKAWSDAQDLLFWPQNTPTTIEGLLAFIDFLKDQEEFEDDEDDGGEFPELPGWWPGAALQVIAASIRTMRETGVIQ
jgi:hypothetical protein